MAKQEHQIPVRLVKGVFVPSNQVFFSKNQLAKEGPESVAPVVIPALVPKLDRSFKSDKSPCPVRALHYKLDRTSDIRQNKDLIFVSCKKGFCKDISPATISSWIKQTVILCYELSDKEATTLHQGATRLQYVQNALARFVTGASKYTHITSTLRTLHWLPIRQRIIFKTLVLVYKYLTTGQSKYFAPYLPLYKSAMSTRRSNPKNLFLQVPSYCASIHKSKVHFNNSFSYDAPKLWNDLPYDIRSAPNLSSFKSRLKTYLFQKSFPL